MAGNYINSEEARYLAFHMHVVSFMENSKTKEFFFTLGHDFQDREVIGATAPDSDWVSTTLRLPCRFATTLCEKFDDVLAILVDARDLLAINPYIKGIQLDEFVTPYTNEEISRMDETVINIETLRGLFTWFDETPETALTSVTASKVLLSEGFLTMGDFYMAVISGKVTSMKLLSGPTATWTAIGIIKDWLETQANITNF